MKIAISAGHYLYTSGKRCLKKLDADETREWVLNARIADKLEEKLKKYECEVLRLDDASGLKQVSLYSRCKIANAGNADILFDLHHNAGINGGTGGGTVVFYYSSSSERKVQADELYNAIVNMTGLVGNRSNKVVKKNYYMLRNTRMPAFLLENGFMDSSTDVPVILSEEHADKTAQGILDFLTGKFGLKFKNPYSEPAYTLYYGRSGMKPEYVSWLQWELVQEGYELQITGEYTAAEDAAVRDFQDKKGLQTDGKCGPLTRAELKED